MALNGKTVSLKYIVAKVYQDLGLQDEESLFIDSLEWAVTALEFIGVYPQFESKTDCIEITNYKGELPCDFIALEGVSYNNTSLRSSTNTFGPQISTSNLITPYSYHQDKIDNGLLVDSKYYFTSGDSFKIENGYIKTSFELGKLYIQYVAQPVDEDGFPLVPDNVSFREALYWFINMKYSYILWRRDELNERFYRDAEDKWHWYCNQAGAQALMPDVTVLENIKRSYLSLKPNLYKFDTFFDKTQW